MSDYPYYLPKTPNVFSQKKRATERSFIYISCLIIFFHIFFPWLSFTIQPQIEKPVRTQVVVHTINLSTTDHSSKNATFLNEIHKEKLLDPVMKVEQAPLPSLTPAPLPKIPLTEESAVAADSPTIKPEEILKAPEVALEIKKETPVLVPVPQAVPKEQKKIPSPSKPPEKKPPTPSKQAKSKVEPKKITKTATPKVITEIEKKKINADQKKVEDLKEQERKRQLIEQNKKIEAQRKIEEAHKKKLAAEVEAKYQEEVRQALLLKEALAQAKNKLATNQINRSQMTASQEKKTVATPLSDKPVSLQIDSIAQNIENIANWSAKEMDYKEEITQILKAHLRLPDYGTVKIELTLIKTGKIEKVKVISSESEKNKNYIEQNIKNLQFPSFGTRFPNHENFTFAITLNNERKN